MHFRTMAKCPVVTLMRYGLNALAGQANIAFGISCLNLFSKMVIINISTNKEFDQAYFLLLHFGQHNEPFCSVIIVV